MLAVSNENALENPFLALSVTDLQRGLDGLLQAYESGGSALRAWLVVHYAEALCRHPDFEGTDEQRCSYGRLAKQWHWLAHRFDDPLDGLGPEAARAIVGARG
ncbi:MAG: hypothetical protein KDI88_06830 [Gammaproteobacteria bacterium]|nr:hypothetical protein [Gammaproteobacteria bacterium]